MAETKQGGKSAKKRADAKAREAERDGGSEATRRQGDKQASRGERKEQARNRQAKGDIYATGEGDTHGAPLLCASMLLSDPADCECCPSVFLCGVRGSVEACSR